MAVSALSALEIIPQVKKTTDLNTHDLQTCSQRHTIRRTRKHSQSRALKKVHFIVYRPILRARWNDIMSSPRLWDKSWLQWQKIFGLMSFLWASKNIACLGNQLDVPKFDRGIQSRQHSISLVIQDLWRREPKASADWNLYRYDCMCSGEGAWSAAKLILTLEHVRPFRARMSFRSNRHGFEKIEWRQRLVILKPVSAGWRWRGNHCSTRLIVMARSHSKHDRREINHSWSIFAQSARQSSFYILECYWNE
jgi:hypothetical protein